MTGSYQQYLAAKRSVDDRALNRRVLERFEDELWHRARGDPDDAVRILELGAGVGSMVARLADRGRLPPRVTYRAVDADRATVDRASDLLPGWLESAGYHVERTANGVVARSGPERTPDAGYRRLDVAVERADAFAIEDDADAVIAAAFLDLVDVDRAVSLFADLLDDDGLVYAPITFDGETAFQPPHPDDDLVVRLYHRHMDEVRDLSGGSRAGRSLLAALSRTEFDLTETGGGDWTIVPRDCAYSIDDATVLAHLLETIDDALGDYPTDVLDPGTRRTWIERRRAHLERGELVLVVHHLDVLAAL